MAIVAGILLAQSALPGSELLVLSKGDHTLSIVDPATKTVIASMPSGPDPHEVVASTDGKMAYISNYGGGAYNTLTPVDLVNHKTLPVIDLGALKGPHGLAFAGGKVWFTAEAAKAVGRFDPDSQKIDWIMGTGQNRTHMLYVSSNLQQIYTVNVNAATVTFMEQQIMTGPQPGGRRPGAPPPPASGMTAPPRPAGGPRLDWAETVIPVGAGAEGFDVSPDGHQLWTANAWDGTISVLDLASKKLTQTLMADVPGANRLKFTPGGKYVLVSTLGGPNVTVVDAKTGTIIKRIAVGRGAAGIQMEPTGRLAYIACTPDDYVALVDLQSMQVVGHIDAGKQPDGMAWID